MSLCVFVELCLCYKEVWFHLQANQAQTLTPSIFTGTHHKLSRLAILPTTLTVPSRAATQISRVKMVLVGPERQRGHSGLIIRPWKHERTHLTRTPSSYPLAVTLCWDSRPTIQVCESFLPRHSNIAHDDILTSLCRWFSAMLWSYNALAMETPQSCTELSIYLDPCDMLSHNFWAV